MDDIIVSNEGVTKLLKGLNPSKTLGPEELHPRALKEIATELGPVLAHLLTRVKSPKNGLLQIYVPSIKRVAELSHVIIVPSHYLVYLESHLNTYRLPAKNDAAPPREFCRRSLS